MIKNTEVKYTWLNRLSYKDREEIVRLYIQGHAILAIAKAFSSTQCTVKYHLRAAGVWIAWQKPNMKQKIERKPTEANRTLAFKHRRSLLPGLADQYDYDELGYRYKKSNKSYGDYLEEEAKRVPLKRSNDMSNNRGAGDKFKCMIHVDIEELSNTPVKSYIFTEEHIVA